MNTTCLIAAAVVYFAVLGIAIRRRPVRQRDAAVNKRLQELGADMDARPNCLSNRYWRDVASRGDWEVFTTAESWLNFCEAIERCDIHDDRLRQIQQVAGSYYTAASRDLQDCEEE